MRSGWLPLSLPLPWEVIRTGASVHPAPPRLFRGGFPRTVPPFGKAAGTGCLAVNGLHAPPSPVLSPVPSLALITCGQTQQSAMVGIPPSGEKMGCQRANPVAQSGRTKDDCHCNRVNRPLSSHEAFTNSPQGSPRFQSREELRARHRATHCKAGIKVDMR